MKTLLNIFLLLSSFLTVQAQSVNKARHSGIDATYSMISIHSKSYYMERTSGCCSNELNLVAINDSGNVIFKKGIAVYEADYFSRIIKTRENQIVVLGYSVQACDVSGIKDFITKLDTNGNVLFQVYMQNAFVFNTSEGEIIDITQHTDSSFYLVTATDLLHYSSTGQFISRVNTGLTDINSIYAFNNGNLLINGKLNFQLKNMEFSTGLTLINQQPATNAIVKFEQLPSGNIVAKTALNSLEKYSAGLILLANSSGAINPANITIQDFTSRNDSVFVTGLVLASATPFYGILDANLASLYQTQTSYTKVRPTGIAVTNKNKVNIITTGSSNTSANVTFSGLYQFGITGTFASNSDIGVESYVTTSSNLFPYYTGPYVSYLPSASFNVVVKNFGTDTVKQFYLNQFQPGMQCNSLFHKLYQITIVPGGTVSVQTGTFNTHYNALILQNQQTYSTTINVCFFTTIPNLSNDVNISNDSYCESVLFKVTGLDENFWLNATTNLFPNPFTNDFVINCPVPMHIIRIYNSTGVLVKEEFVDTKDWELKNVELATGIYVLKIETEKGTVIKKVLKN